MVSEEHTNFLGAVPGGHCVPGCYRQHLKKEKGSLPFFVYELVVRTPPKNCTPFPPHTSPVTTPQPLWRICHRGIVSGCISDRCVSMLWEKRHACTPGDNMRWFFGINAGYMPVICQEQSSQHHKSLLQYRQWKSNHKRFWGAHSRPLPEPHHAKCERHVSKIVSITHYNCKFFLLPTLSKMFCGHNLANNARLKMKLQMWDTVFPLRIQQHVHRLSFSPSLITAWLESGLPRVHKTGWFCGPIPKCPLCTLEGVWRL